MVCAALEKGILTLQAWRTLVVASGSTAGLELCDSFISQVARELAASSARVVTSHSATVVLNLFIVNLIMMILD